MNANDARFLATTLVNYADSVAGLLSYLYYSPELEDLGLDYLQVSQLRTKSWDLRARAAKLVEGII